MIRNTISVFFLLLIISLDSFSQEINFSGNVIDSVTKLPVSGASVSINKSDFITSTDYDGNFSVFVKPGNIVVYINHIGYKALKRELNISSENRTYKFILGPSDISTGEITITSTRKGNLLKNVPYPVEIVVDDDILKRPYNTVPEALIGKPGISITRDGIWATDISIRGLSKSSIVTLVDGNRIETGTDISARLSMIEPSDIDRIEIIKGGVSSLYGTGAFGGIVNIFTKGSDFSVNKIFNGSVISGFNSVNKNVNGWLSFNVSSPNYFAKFSGSISNAENTKTPSGEIPNSQFYYNNLNFIAGAKLFSSNEFVVNYQKYYARDVGIPGAYPLFPNNAVVTYPQEKRDMFSFEYRLKSPKLPFKQLSVKYFYQYILRDVENIPGTVQIKPAGNGQPKQKISVLKITPNARHYTNGLQIQSDWSITEENYLLFGIDLWRRNLDSKREREQKIETYDSTGSVIVSTTNKITGEKPVPDAEYTSMGAYIQDEMKFFNERLKLTLGGRIDKISVNNSIAYQPVYEIINGIQNNNPAGQKVLWKSESADDISWSANLGTIFNVMKDIDLTFLLSRSFRSPSLEERYQYIDLGNLVRVGNPYLAPEKGYFIDLGLRVWKNKYNFKGNVFYNGFTDLVTEIPGTYEGRQALLKVNIGQARIYGYEIDFSYNIYRSLTAYAMLSYTRGEDTENKTNLPQIPPLNSKVGVKLTFFNLITADLNSIIFAEQNNTAPGELDTPGYATFNLSLISRTFTTGLFRFQIFGGIDNILDKQYRNHLSTSRGSVTSEPGINFFLKFKIEY